MLSLAPLFEHFVPRRSHGSDDPFSHLMLKPKRFICTRSIARFALAGAIVCTGKVYADQTYDQTNASAVWDTATQNWDVSLATWTNLTTNNAIFTGTAKTVDVNGTINVGNITFNSSNWNIGDLINPGTLNFAAPSTVTITNTADTDTISAAIASGAITKAGTGTLILSGTNTFSGAVNVSAGNLKITSNSALGDTTSGTTVANGASLILGNGVTVTGETLSIAGNGSNSAGALQADNGAMATWTGTITLDAAAGGRVGAGSGGTLNLTGLIQGAAANNGLFVGEIPSAATPGTVIISGTGNTYAGNTSIIRGVLQLGASNALPTTTVVDVSSSAATEDAVFDLHGFNQNVAGIQRSSSTGAGIITNNSATPSTLTITDSAAHTYSGSIRDGSSTVALTKAGTSTLTLTGVNTYSGATSITNGVLAVSTSSSLSSNSAITVNGGQLILGNNVTITGQSIGLTGGGLDSNGALQSAASGTATWAGNIAVSASGARLGGGVSGTLNVNGVISGTGNIVFGRANNSTTILNAVNTFTGDTQIFANVASTNATLKIGVDNAINAGSKLSTLGSPMNASSTATLDLNGHVLTMRGLDSSALPATTGNAQNMIVADNATGTTSILTIGDTTGSWTFGGTIKDGTSGAGGMSLVKINAGTQILTGSDTYTGSTTVNAGTLQIGAAPTDVNHITNTTGVGALASTSFILNGGTLSLNDLGVNNTNNSNRIADTANISLRGGAFALFGSDQTATNSSETVGTFNLDAGISTITVKAGGSNSATLTANQFVRTANSGGIALVNGVGLGSTSTTANRILVTTAPTLVGTTAPLDTGINSAAKNTQIVPYLLGEATSTTGGVGTASGTANTFVTYTATGGFRPLNLTDEFTQDLFTAGNNVHAKTTMLTGTTLTSVAINSLVIDMAGQTSPQLNIGSGQVLTVTSGALLFSTGGTTINGPGKLDFGNTEGIVTNVTGGVAIIGAQITATAGVTFNGTASSTTALGAQSTYSSGTLLKSGLVVPQQNSTVTSGVLVSGPFGIGTLTFGGGSIRSQTSAATTIANAITFAADTTIPSASTDRTLTFTGAVTLTGTRTITQNSTANTVFSGNIGDGGNAFGLTVTGSATSAPVILSGANTYTGPTTVKSSTLVVSGSLSGSTAVLVGDAQNPLTAATLGGSGTVGNVTVGAIAGNTGAALAPHAGSAITSTGVTLSANAVTFASATSHLTMEIGRASAYNGAAGTGAAGGDVSDHLATSGPLTLNGADLQLSLLTTAYTPVNGDLFFLTINSGGTINGTFSSLNGAATNLSEGSIFTMNSQAYEITYQANFATNSFTGGNDIALEAVIPEPGSLVSLIGGLGCLIGVQRLRRSRGGKAKS